MKFARIFISISVIAGQNALDTFTTTVPLRSIVADKDFLYVGTEFDSKTNAGSIFQMDHTGNIVKILSGHTDAVTCLFIDSIGLISGSADKTVKLWDIKTGKPKMSFVGHTGQVLSVFYSNQRIFSSGSDNLIIQWDMDGTQETVFKGHGDKVTSLYVLGDRLFSGSFDRKIIEWDIISGKSIKEYIGHTEGIWGIDVDKYLYSASDDNTLAQWDIQTGKQIRTYHGHVSHVQSIKAVGNDLFSSGYDYTLRRWNTATGELVTTFNGHQSYVMGFAIVDGILFSASTDSSVKHWDVQPAIKAITSSGSLGVSNPPKTSGEVSHTTLRTLSYVIPLWIF
jgi:WD40 repeat protein